MEPSTRRGSCLCGAIGFEVDLPSKWCAHCHCTMCRRAHGAAFVTWFGVESGHFRLTSGVDVLTRYASSPGATRSFCSRCGSSLFFESTRWPGEVHVVLANLDGELDRAPQAHVFWETHVAWAIPGDDLPRKTIQPAT